MSKDSNFSIPEEFLSFKTNTPIERCMLCGKNVLLDTMPYLIEKAFQRNIYKGTFEVVFEYALCYTCQKNAN